MLDLFIPEIDLILSIVGVLVLGSAFALISNIAIDRVAKNQPMTTPEPYCKNCSVSLAWDDLIPVYSYLKHKGKCRYCGARIPVRNFVIEISEILWVGLLVLHSGWSYESVPDLVFGMCLMSIIAMDYENRYVSDSLLLFMVMMSAVAILAFRQDQYPAAVLSLVIGAIVMVIYNIIKFFTLGKVSFKWSEIKFGGVLGIFLGFPEMILCLLLSWVIGAAWGSVNIKCRHKPQSLALPNYPAILAASGMLVIVFGESILNGYFQWIAN